MSNVRQYRINGVLFPVPDSTSWERIVAGRTLSTNLPIYSPYMLHRWNMPMLPNCDYASLLDDIAGTELDSLVTDPPDSAEDLEEFTEAKITEIASTHSGGHPRGVTITFEVFVS